MIINNSENEKSNDGDSKAIWNALVSQGQWKPDASTVV